MEHTTTQPHTHTHSLPTQRQYFYVCGRCRLTKATHKIICPLNSLFRVIVSPHSVAEDIHSMFVCACVVCTCVFSRPSGFHCGLKGMSPLSPTRLCCIRCKLHCNIETEHIALFSRFSFRKFPFCILKHQEDPDIYSQYYSRLTLFAFRNINTYINIYNTDCKMLN